MKPVYFSSPYTAIPAGLAARSNSSGLFRNLSRTIVTASEKVVQRFSDPAHPFHLLKAIVITQPAGFTSMLAACLSSWTVGLGQGYIAGTIEKKKGGAEDTFGLVVQALRQTEPISDAELQRLEDAAMEGDWGALATLRELIEKKGDQRGVGAFVKVIEKGKGPAPEIARSELESVEPDELMKKVFSGDSEALNAIIVMVFVSKNPEASLALSSYYADLAGMVVTADREKIRADDALARLSEVIFKDPDAIPWMGKVAEEGILAGWEALGEAMKKGPPKIADKAISMMRDTPLSHLVDRVRDNPDPYASEVLRTANVLKILVIEVGRLAAMLELEKWPNRIAEVTLRDLAYNKKISGAQEAYDRWRKQFGVPTPPTGTEIVDASKPKRRRDDEPTLVGMPTHNQPPKSTPPPKKKK